MKGLLLERGYLLYTEVWSDQPPFFTLILSWWLHLFDTTTMVSRLLVILLSTLLVWAFFLSVSIQTSMFSAMVATFLLIISEEYIRLSLSIMIGLPALSLVMLSISLLLLSQRRGSEVLVAASGVVMAAALQTKLIALAPLPGIVAYLLLCKPAAYPATFRRWFRLRRLAWWVVPAMFTYLLFVLLTNVDLFGTLIVPHVGRATRDAFQSVDNLSYLRAAATRHLPYIVLFAIGTVWAIRRRQIQILLPVGWLLTAARCFATSGQSGTIISSCSPSRFHGSVHSAWKGFSGLGLGPLAPMTTVDVWHGVC